MSRPPRSRRVRFRAEVTHFKPQGVPLRFLEAVSLGEDELEAMRLADLEGLYQADGAEQMGVSRQTFGNILNSAHRKVAEALTSGKAIRIEGGPVVDREIDDSDLPPGRRHGRGWGRGRRGGGCSRIDELTETNEGTNEADRET